MILLMIVCVLITVLDFFPFCDDYAVNPTKMPNFDPNLKYK